MRLSDRSIYALGRLGRVASPPCRFTIIAPARSGSELLVSLLESHSAIRCDGELCKYAREHPARFVDGHAVKARLRGVRAYGWKLGVTSLLYAQDRYGGAENWLRQEVEMGRHLVFLWRRNLLNQAISFLTAQQSGIFHVWVGDDIHHVERDVLDPERVLGRMVNQEEELEWIRQALAPLPHLDLVYEDDLVDASRHQTTVDRVVGHLGLQPESVDTTLIRHPVTRGLDRLANADDVRALVAVTRFKPMLNEP